MTEPANVLHIATGTLLAVPDAWAVLEWLDRDGCAPGFEAEAAARDLRWAEMMRRKKAVGLYLSDSAGRTGEDTGKRPSVQPERKSTGRRGR